MFIAPGFVLFFSGDFREMRAETGRFFHLKGRNMRKNGMKRHFLVAMLQHLV